MAPKRGSLGSLLFCNIIYPLLQALGWHYLVDGESVVADDVSKIINEEKCFALY